MSVALDPELPPGFLDRLILVDITPGRGELSSEFKGYIEGMKKIEASKVQTRKQAEEILIEYEKVGEHVGISSVLVLIVTK